MCSGVLAFYDIRGWIKLCSVILCSHSFDLSHLPQLLLLRRLFACFVVLLFCCFGCFVVLVALFFTLVIAWVYCVVLVLYVVDADASSLGDLPVSTRSRQFRFCHKEKVCASPPCTTCHMQTHNTVHHFKYWAEFEITRRYHRSFLCATLSVT